MKIPERLNIDYLVDILQWNRIIDISFGCKTLRSQKTYKNFISNWVSLCITWWKSCVVEHWYSSIIMHSLVAILDKSLLNISERLFPMSTFIVFLYSSIGNNHDQLLKLISIFVFFPSILIWILHQWMRQVTIKIFCIRKFYRNISIDP